MEKLLDLLASLSPLSERFVNDLKKDVVMLSLPKNYLLLELAKVADHAYFLNTGFAMSFRFVDGKKQIEEFYKESRIIISPTSFFERRPSQESIQLLEQSEVLHVPYERVMVLLQCHSEADVIYRATMNLYYEESRERIHDLQHLSAIERYVKLNREFTKLEQLVPQEYIASYLGIAPQSLSRLKRELGEL